MSNHPKYRYADWREMHGAKKEALADLANAAAGFMNRVRETAVGAAEGVASDHINNVGNALYGESVRQNRQTEGEIKGWQDTISAYEDALKDPASTRSERETANTVINDLQRRIDAYQGAYGVGGANERAAKSVWDFADRLDDSAKRNIQSAKQGAGPIGTGLVDLGVLGVETLSDAASPAAVYSKLFRLMGRDSQTARRSGADYDAAMAYGGASGFSGAAIETLFDGLGGAYGKGSVDEGVAAFLDKTKLNDKIKKRVRSILPDLGEGIESMATDLSNQVLKQLYNQKNTVQNLSETDLDKLISNVVNNTILAFLVREKDK